MVSVSDNHPGDDEQVRRVPQLRGPGRCYRPLPVSGRALAGRCYELLTVKGVMTTTSNPRQITMIVPVAAVTALYNVTARVGADLLAAAEASRIVFSHGIR